VSFASFCFHETLMHLYGKPEEPLAAGRSCKASAGNRAPVVQLGTGTELPLAPALWVLQEGQS